MVFFAVSAAGWVYWISGSAFRKRSITTRTTCLSAVARIRWLIRLQSPACILSPGILIDEALRYMSDDKLKSATLAYQNEPFLNSPDGRILRILSEYMEPLSRFRREQI